MIDFKKKSDEETEEIKKRKNELKKVLRLVQVIPYLPDKKIDSQLLLSLKNRLEDSVARERVEKYFQYFEKNWIQNTVWPPETWSIHGQDVATNNFSESRNKSMTLYFGRHPYPWVFIGKYNLCMLNNFTTIILSFHRIFLNLVSLISNNTLFILILVDFRYTPKES